jgi:hypothetical protein
LSDWEPPAEAFKAPTSPAWEPPAEAFGASGLASNALENAKRVFNPINMAKGGMETVKEGAYDLPIDLHKTLAQLVGGVVTRQPTGQTPMGARMQDIAQSEEVQNPSQWAYKNPIDAAMQAATVISPFMPEAEAVNAAREGAATRASRFAQQQAVKAMEGSRGQIMQVGPESARELGQFALDKGVVSPFKGEIGMERALNDLEQTSGAQIGAARAAGDVLGGAPEPSLLQNNIEAELAPKYGSGMRVGERGALGHALEEVGKIDKPSFTGIAQKATEMNQYAKGMHQINQPSGALTDVANILSRENNAALANVLKPEEFAAYKQALGDYGSIQKLQEFFLRKEARELAGRGGGIVRGIKDAFGHKVAATGADAMSSLLSHPAFARVLPVLTEAARRGPQAITAANYILQQKDPDYNKLITQGIDGQSNP